MGKWLTVLFICLVSSVSFAQFKSFKIEGETIHLGDSKFELLSKLGDPNGTIFQEFELTRRNASFGYETTFVTVEKWFYNFGSRRFTQIFTLKNKVLVDIEQRDYGFDYADPSNCSRVSLRARIGDIIPEVLMKCGDPSYTDVFHKERIEKLNEFEYKRLNIRIEEWTYNFGPSHPIHILTFENGYLVEVAEGQRGF